MDLMPALLKLRAKVALEPVRPTVPMAVPSSLKVTDPVGLVTPDRVAVKVVLWPTGTGLWELDSAVVVAVE